MKLGKDCYGNTVEIIEVLKNNMFIVKRVNHYNKSAYVTYGIKEI
jgi:hypothetical protein